LNAQGARKRVVMVGGFAGIASARELAKSNDTQVKLIDKN
jgi:NADH dehydrogenase FAD-containing subunit